MKRFRQGALILTLLVIVSCGDEMPSLGEWERQWREVVGSVEDQATEPITADQCEQTLAYLRQVRPDLDPPPLPDLEPPVDSWFAEAEDAFFECQFDDQDRRTEVFRSLETYEAEVDTVLSIEG